MHATKFSLDCLLSYAKAAVFTAAVGGLCSGAFAQGVFEGSGEEEDSSCVGDGCGIEIPAQANQTGSTNDTENAENGSVQSATDSATVTAASPADSASNVDSKPASNTANYFDDEDSRPTFVNETAADYRARKEGFSKSIQFGFRAAGGISLNLLSKHTEGWNVGMDLEGGASAKLPLSNDFMVAAGLDFGYRTYSYEADTDYGHNEASVSEMLFEIPVFLQYNFMDDGFFAGIGLNVGLKMQGETEFKQTIVKKGKTYKDKRSNTLPTAGVELGGLLDIGYVVNKNIVIDLRLIQNMTNLLNDNVIAESTLMKSNLLTSHAVLGVTFLL